MTRSKKIATATVFLLGGSGYLALKALIKGDITVGAPSAIFFCAVCAIAYWRAIFKD